MKELIDFIARTLADQPDEVEVTESDDRRQLQLRLADDDVGRLIGRRGRTAKAMRVLLDSGPDRQRLDIEGHGAEGEEEAAAE
ncbi:MAG: KH domain-containing protein [bacterium]|nr:KH domain-containing protein [bacterium]